MKIHEETKVRYLLESLYTADQVEDIMSVITDWKEDESDLEELLNEINN